MPQPIPYKFRLAYFLAFVLVFLLGFPILAFYSAGYSLNETFGITARGGIYVSTPEAGTSVFIGNDLEGVSSFFKKEILVNKLKPDQYMVLATHDSFWPWAKVVQVKRGEVEALFPLLVPKVIPTLELEKTDSSYKEISGLFLEKATTTRIARREVKVWIADDRNDAGGNTVFAQWLGGNDNAPKYFCNAVSACLDPIIVFRSAVPIRTFDFYPLRSDAIILAIDNGVYAIEIDNRTYQNFYPLYRGIMPDFRVTEDDELLVSDESTIISLELEL
jgi:hypothetical protein